MEAAPATHRSALVLSLSPRGAAQLAHHPEFQPLGTGPPKTQHLLSRYYDTASHELAQAGYSLRVTRSGNMVLQTLETASTSGLMTRRGEWEWPLLNDQPDLSLLTAILPPQPFPPPGLQEMFVADLTRTERMLQLAPDTIVKTSLDEGTIQAGAATEPVRDLALKVLNGPTAALYHLALDLHARTPLALCPGSLATRGIRLTSGRLPASQRAGPAQLSAAASGSEAFGRLLAECLNHLLANQPAALAGSAEGVHQMRVAIRRLRALLLLYRPALAARRRARFEKELQRIGRVFGQARDWDVFCTELLPHAGREASPADLYDDLKRLATEQRLKAHDAFADECRGHKFTATVLELAAWAEDRQDRPARLGRAKLGRKLTDLAPRWLDRLACKVEERGKDLSRAGNADLHKLRKSIKKLRYGIEFTASLFPRKKSRLYQKRCKALQDRLGLINDSVTSLQLAKSLARDADLDLRPALSALAGYESRQRQNGLDELAGRWKAYRREARFWR